ncbi:MAG: hypothetical protein AB7T18_03620 [Alphaproteobacteria bacterium]
MLSNTLAACQPFHPGGVVQGRYFGPRTSSAVERDRITAKDSHFIGVDRRVVARGTSNSPLAAMRAWQGAVLDRVPGRQARRRVAE